jgi:hypothetical protein
MLISGFGGGIGDSVERTALEATSKVREQAAHLSHYGCQKLHEPRYSHSRMSADSTFLGRFEKASRGGFAGRAAPLGYKDRQGGLVADEEAAETVRRIFAMKTENATLQGEHEEVWGRLVTGWLHNISSPTKQSCETPSLAGTHPIRPQTPDPSPTPKILQFKVWLIRLSPMI